MTLKEAALRWFSNLPTGVITSFGEFKRMFIAQFISAQKPLKSSQALLRIRQDPGESLRSFITRFQREVLEVRDLEPAVAHAALAQGLREGPFRYALGLQRPKSLAELLEAANNHISAEEYNAPPPEPPRIPNQRPPPPQQPRHFPRNQENPGRPADHNRRFGRNRPRPSEGQGRFDRRPREQRPVKRSPPPPVYHNPNQRLYNVPPIYHNPTIYRPQELTPLRVSMAEVVEAIQNREFFKHPPPMKSG